jgi:flavin reductase (DIM6/NTAB) family NADH-FMN oxidoreductase RutF
LTKIAGEVTDSLFPLPVVLVSCSNKSGKKNLITLAWVSKACADPPMICAAIRQSRYSYSMIKESGEFVVNVPTESIARELDLCGQVSGKDVDKFAVGKFTIESAKKVRAPMVKECPANFECVVRNSLPLGTHDLFIGEVVAVHYDQSILTADGDVDYRKAKPVVYVSPDYWTLGDRIGTYGYSTKK